MNLKVVEPSERGQDKSERLPGVTTSGHKRNPGFPLDLDLVVLLFILAVAGLVSLVVGVAAGARSLWIPPVEALKEGG